MIGVFVQLNESSRQARGRPVGYVVQESGCWDWVGNRSAYGYGKLIDPHTGRPVLAHRWLYQQTNGPISDGLYLDHFACGNPACVNPAHVRPVTPRENALRSEARSSLNRAKTECPRGHPYSPGNLVESDLRRGTRRCLRCDRARRRGR